MHGCTVDALRVTKTLVRNLDTRVRASRQTQSMRASINAPSLLTAAWRWLEIGDRRSQNGSCNSAAQGGKAQWATYGSDGVQIGDRRMEAGRARPRRFWEEWRSQKARPKGHRAGRGSENRGWKGATHRGFQWSGDHRMENPAHRSTGSTSIPKSLFTPPRRPRTGRQRVEIGRERIGNKIQDVSCMPQPAGSPSVTHRT